MRLINAFKKLSINKWRYIFWIIGFIMFVAPFALLTKLIYFTIGNIYPPDLHGICFRMPFEWIFSGRIFYLFQYPIMFGTVILALIIALVLGPIFCGWLCPVGAVSEALSRIIPFPYRLRIKDTSITRSLRYGFLAGWIVISLLIGLGYTGVISSICCRYCASSVLQSLVDAFFSSTVLYWHSGSIIVLIFWLIIGGVFTVGGRAWCIMFCPLGAMSGLFHSLGAKLGFYRTIRRNNVKCNDCDICMKVCPMWAISSNKSIDRTLCINCKECVKRCPNNAFTMVWRRIS